LENSLLIDSNARASIEAASVRNTLEKQKTTTHLLGYLM